MATSTTNQVQALYIGYFGRAADPSGLNYWVSAVNNGTITLSNLGTAFAASQEYQGLYGSLTNAQLVSAIYTNVLGRAADNDGLNFWVGELNKGTATANNVVAKMLGSLGAADQLNIDNRVTSANAYTTSVTDTTYSTSSAATAAGIGGTSANPSLVLTTGQDKFTGTNGDDVIRGVAGVNVGAQDQSTLNSSDILDGGAGNDLLAINMTGNTYAGGATIKNIETLQIGTNLTTPVTFDYNVNNGAYEVTGVNKVIYDQITNGESLAVNNITPTSTTNTTPTLSWENEAGSRAGTVSATYREASTTGTNTNQAVNLKNVSATNAGDGVLNIGAGVETITLNSTGTVANNTLSNSTNTDSGVYSAAADLVSSGSLSKVVLTGDVAIGKVGGVVTDTSGARAAFVGLTDRAAGTDLGITADTGTSTVNATKSNLLSVDARVTTVDASAMTASANVRFVAKTDGTATNVTFLGGSANDYAEFELGNVTANGGAGNDTFAFITNASGITNSTYGAGDTINGGSGTDTLQLGLNGVGTYNLGTTEFSNTTGIDVLDLRGATNTVAVSSSLVSGADAGKFEIHTDRIVQSSSTSALNPTVATANNAKEDASVNTIDLTNLTGSQGVKFVGGSGSDRLILNDASFNQNMVLDGGTRETATGLTAGKYDTLTVVNSAVLDRTDLANVSNFEGLILSESVTGNSTFSIELTSAFLLANTLATDDANTSINDTIFQIGTGQAANGTALNAGDSVTIDISGLLNPGRTAVDPTLGNRRIDTSTLTAAGVTVKYVVDGAAATAAQIAAVLATDAKATDITGSAANVAPPTPTANVVVTAGTTVTGTAGTNDNFTVAALANLNNATVTGTATDTETLTLQSPMTVALNNGTTGGTLTNIDNVVLANGTNDVSFAADINAGTKVTVTGGTGNDKVATANLALASNYNLGAGNDTLALAAGAYTGALNGGDGTDTLQITAAGVNISGATLSSFELLDFTAAGATARMNIAQYNSFASVNNSAGTATAQIIFNDAGSVTLGTAVTNYALANGTNTVDATGAANYNLVGGTGSDTFNFGTQLTNADTVNGGTGTDTVNVTGSADLTNVTGVENIAFSTSTAAQTLTTGTYTPGVNSTITAAGSTVAVTIDASAITSTANAVTIIDGQGNDTIKVSTTDAARAQETVNLSTGGTDTVLVNNGAIAAYAASVSDSHVTINSFTAGNAGDKLQFQIGGVASSTSFQEITTAGMALTAANSAVEINSSLGQVVTPTDGASVAALIANAVGATAAISSAEFVLYGNGNAYVYQATLNVAANVAAGDVTNLELVGVVNNVAANSLDSGNFA